MSAIRAAEHGGGAKAGPDAHLAADFPQHPVCRHIAVAVLMALSAMGVQIAPLRAGAGSSVSRWVLFYLLDDAFRVGGYIQAGRDKGTVEGFTSVRSGCGITAARFSVCRSTYWVRPTASGDEQEKQR